MESSAAAPATDQTPQDEGQRKENTISNLPLLFANGYPTSLEKITVGQLVKFIPFMVGCSLGSLGTPVESPTTPPWWPEDLEFSLPPVKPPNLPETDWLRKLKELVCICYEHHNNVFLLRFCTVLSKYEPECLRFINNYNSTTSLYDRFNNKLLVTFRNENMLYDREYNNRKCLLPRRKTGSSTGGGESAAEDELEEISSRPSMVEPPMFDIYLCDYCDAELYTLEACREHEKSCRETQYESDVIPLDEDLSAAAPTIASAVKRRGRKTVAPERDIKAKRRKQVVYEDTVEDEEEDEGDSNDAQPVEPLDAAELERRTFMSHFSLVSSKGTPAQNWPKQGSPRKSGGARSPIKQALEKAKDKRRRTDRSVLTVQRCATVPLTSPMGQFLLKTQRAALTLDYKQERNERLERFCMAPVIRDGLKPKWLTQVGPAPEPCPVTYRAIDYRPMFEKDEGYDRKYVHQFKFPRRQFSTKWRELSWLALSKVLLKNCRPCTVELVRLTETDIRVYFLHLAIERKKRELMELRRADLMRMYMQQQRALKRPPEECIDLCSSSDEEGEGTSGTAPKRPCLDASRGPSEEDEMKENRGDGVRRPVRTHSALQEFGRPLSLAVSGTWPLDAIHSAQGSPQTAAQLGVLLPNDNPQTNNRNTSQQANAAIAMGQPSSYLFLTKQQLLYQQSEVPTTVGDESVVSVVVQEEVVVETEPPPTSNSTLGGGNDANKRPDESPILAKQLTQETTNSGRNSLPARTNNSVGGKDFKATTPGSSSRMRKSSPIDAFSLPKKLPSLIRIAPA